MTAPLSRRTAVGSGLSDKLYWRWVGDVAHCFKRTTLVDDQDRELRRAFVSLCDAMHEYGAASSSSTGPRSGSQRLLRPPAFCRCPQCDCREMDRRGWEQSGDESPDWRLALRFRVG
jgi:hypothetical protein